MRSTTICRVFGLAVLALIVGGWLRASQEPVRAEVAQADEPSVRIRLVDQPLDTSPLPVAAVATQKATDRKGNDKKAADSKGDLGSKSPSASDARREQFRRQVEAGKRKQEMLERIWKAAARHEPTSHERNHRSVKEAFRPTVASARRATVRVLSDGKQVALGAVVRADGLVATKGSEIRGKLEVELSDGRKVTAEKLAADEANDLVLLRVAADKLPTVSFASAQMPGVGSWLATCGTGEAPLAVGVVSVPAREIRPPRGLLGVRLADGRGGALIEEVVPESAAAHAGLLPGDQIVEINKKSVKNHDDAVSVLRLLQAGDKVQLKFSREKEQIELKVTLGSLEMSGMRADRFHMMNMLGGPLSTRRAGFTSAIQHDTVLVPQDCGGPVVDLDGRVVGLNIARAGRVDSYALPMAVVDRLVKAQAKPAPTQAVSLQKSEK